MTSFIVDRLVHIVVMLVLGFIAVKYAPLNLRATVWAICLLIVWVSSDARGRS